MINPAIREDLYALFPKNGVGVELGVHIGKNAERLLAIADPSRLWLVDPWPRGVLVFDGVDPGIDGEAAYRACGARFRAYRHVKCLRTTSVLWLGSISDASLDWAYVDTVHTYETTRDELLLLARKLKPTGIIAGHDYHDEPWAEVKRAVDEFVAAGQWRIEYLTLDRWPSYGLIRNQ